MESKTSNTAATETKPKHIWTVDEENVIRQAIISKMNNGGLNRGTNSKLIKELLKNTHFEALGIGPVQGKYYEIKREIEKTSKRTKTPKKAKRKAQSTNGQASQKTLQSVNLPIQATKATAIAVLNALTKEKRAEVFAEYIN